MRPFLEHQEDHHRWHGEKHGTRRGDIRLIILAMLKEKPMHGYELISTLDQRTNGLWRPSPGSIYPMLQLLEEQDIVTSQSDDSGKKIYTLTDVGRAEADKVDLGKHKWDLRHGDHENIREMIGTMHELKKLIRRIALAEPAKRDAARDIINEARQKLTELMDADQGDITDEPQTEV